MIPDHAPDGQAYLFMLVIKSVPEPFQRSEIVCFVRPLGRL
jgi:hypothetical protein